MKRSKVLCDDETQPAVWRNWAGFDRELGYVDTTSTLDADDSGDITLLSTIPQGSSTSQRVGKCVKLVSLQVRGELIANNIAAGGYNHCELLIVYDAMPRGALPAVGDVLAAPLQPLSFALDTNSTRFKILKRISFDLLGSPAETAPVNGMSWARSFNFYLDLDYRPTIYKAATTGVIADHEEGALYALTIGNNTAGTSAATFTIRFRLRYYDF